MGMIASRCADRHHAPVAVVIATCGKERVDFLLKRALPSVEKQINHIDRVFVASDNDKDSDPLSQGMIRSCFEAPDRHKVFLLHNSRTRHMSGTGAWNTGIVEAFKSYGSDCWVAILDDDDEWSDEHVRACLDASESNGASCKWIVSGIIRRRSNGEDHEEPIPATKPSADDFFTTNPGVQGSNLFVKCGALVEAGLFDESLPSTTDRDLCIRLSDLLQVDSESSFASTTKHTVIHHAGTHNRVSTRGSPAKIEGLKIFYYKHAPRMNAEQRAAFKSRANERFGCDESEFLAQGPSHVDQAAAAAARKPLLSWSGDELELNRRTKSLLPLLGNDTDEVNGKKDGIFGVITGDMLRLDPLLKDLGQASESPCSDFRAFVVVFANSGDLTFAGYVRDALERQKLRGYVIDGSNDALWNILSQCRSYSSNEDAAKALPLPICLSRTVLQVFISYIARELDDVNAVVILDDDKRLPMGWSPFSADGDQEVADVQIGRDLRTPPNPTLLSLRTNLLDAMYAFDLAHFRGDASGGQEDEVNELLRFCQAIDIYGPNKFDWYYDKSSSRSNHLEAPVLSYGLDQTQGPAFVCGTFLHSLLLKLLVGTPFARDVIPLESGPTLQRGGCLVIIKKEDSSFDVLAIEQDAPIITLAVDKTIHSRRSDSFWCKQVKKSKNKSIEVNPRLYVYHDNSFDGVPSPSVMRRTMVQEVLGAVLCRDKDNQRLFKDKAVLELKIWLSRVRGLLKTLRSRPYFTDEMEQALVRPLEAIIDEIRWQQEVFDVVDREFDRLEAFEPHPTDFTAPPTAIHICRAELSEICFQWNIPKRIRDAEDVLMAHYGSPGSFAGIGHEGVVFEMEGFAYKIIDQVKREDLPDASILNKLNAAFVKGTSTPMIKSRFIRDGKHYRGGHGLACLQLLKSMKEKGLCCRNISPNNIIIYREGRGVTLKLVDLGRDLLMAPASPSFAGTFKYEAEFMDMCRRAFLCYRFGSYANNAHGLRLLKEWMRKSSLTDGNIPQLDGFDIFMAALESLQQGEPRHRRLFRRLLDHSVTTPIVVSELPHLTRPADAIDGSKDDSAVLDSIAAAVETWVLSTPRGRKLAVCVEDPLSVAGRQRRPLWYYRRHLKWLSTRFSFSISEEDVQDIDQDCFETYIEYHVFLLSFDERPAIGTVLETGGCHLMIKSCPMEHNTIVEDVRRIVHTLERPSTFKSITLLVDWSISNGFLRQYTSCDDEDLGTYKEAIDLIKEERLVDRVIDFSPKDEEGECVIGVNRRWFGQHGCSATHSVSGQQYASTLYGFDQLREMNCYIVDDLVLHCDADIMFHCDPILDGVTECLSYFSSDPRLLTFAFPILSKSPSAEKIYENKGQPCRFEIRCSFVHLERLSSMLPLKVSDAQRSDVDDFCIKQGWWRILDENIKEGEWKSCRGSLGGSNSWFFVHPQNSVKRAEGPQRMIAIADRLANALQVDSLFSLTAMASKGCRFAWQEQQDRVNLVHPGEWLCERNEPYVVVAYGCGTSYGRALRFLDSLKRQISDFKKGGVGLILINDGSDNYHCKDTNDKIHQVARGLFGDTISFLNIGKRMGKASIAIDHAVNNVCGQDTSVITFARLEDCFLGRGALSAILERLSPSSNEKSTDLYGEGVMNAFWELYSANQNEEVPVPCYAHGGIITTSAYSASNPTPLFDSLVVFHKEIFPGIKDGSDLKAIEAIDATQFVEGGFLYLKEDGRLEDACIETPAECRSSFDTGICDECCALSCACGHINISHSQALPSSEKNLTKIAPNNHFSWRVASTELPCREFMAQLYVSEEFPEGDLKIEIVALVKGERIGEAEKVHVRMHSECLTGDIFYSKKCDCGEQKTRFLEIMEHSSHAVLLYIRGHEGRGAGLFKKIKAYFTLDKKGSITHIDALLQEGCKVDARSYDAAVKFLRHYLKIKSIVLYTNNPKKVDAIEKFYDNSAVKIMRMSTTPTEHNSQYLKEKETLMGHEGLIVNRNNVERSDK